MVFLTASQGQLTEQEEETEMVAEVTKTMAKAMANVNWLAITLPYAAKNPRYLCGRIRILVRLRTL